MTDALGQVKTFSYNLDNTVSQVAYANAVNPTSTRNFTYDPNYMRLSTAQNGWGTVTYAYNSYATDPFATPITGGGRISTISNNVISSSQISFVDDALGRTTNRSVNGSANSDTWTFDAIDRVTAESNVLGGFTFNYLNPTYGTNQVSSIVYPFGSPTAQQSNFSWYTSSSPTQFEQLQTITNVAGGTSPPNLSQYGYTYNPVSDMSPWTQQVNGGTTNSITLGYDLCDQLLTASATSFWNYTYGYDNAANRTSANNGSGAITATVNDLNQITALSSGPTLIFDANGNMTSDGTNSYSWDAENRLIKITYPGTGNNSQFTFDPLGGLVEIVETVGGSVTSTKQFVRTAGHILEERNASSTVEAQFFDWGQTRSSTTCFYTKDHLGSIRDVTSSGGTEQYGYDPYGVPTATGSGAVADFQYAGYYYHAASGLNLTQNRAYSSSLGRFINRDPIGENGGINLYAYVGNGPIGFSDPSGLDFTAVQIGSALGGAIGGVGGLVGGAVLGGAVGAVVGGILVGGSGLVTAGGPGLILGGGGGIGAGAIGGGVIGGSIGAGAGYGAGSIVGGAIGGWIGGYGAGGGIGSGVTVCAAKPTKSNYDKAPGYPGYSEAAVAAGYQDPKRGPSWVKTEDGKSRGWLDSEGRVWVPTGDPSPERMGAAHGGPQWDVQIPAKSGGGYFNVYP